MRMKSTELNDSRTYHPEVIGGIQFREGEGRLDEGGKEGSGHLETGSDEMNLQ